jgi:hypothetical protein
MPKPIPKLKLRQGKVTQVRPKQKLILQRGRVASIKSKQKLTPELKKIILRSKKLRRRWGEPHRIVESTPEVTTKEELFIKAGNKFVSISKNRTESTVDRDSKKYLRFLGKYKGKTIMLAHTHPSNVRHLSSSSDITSYFFDFLYRHIYENKSLNNITKRDINIKQAIFVVDEKGKDIGRVHYHLTPKTIDILKEGISDFSEKTRKAVKQKINDNIMLLRNKEILRLERENNYRLNDDFKFVIELHATKHYLTKVLGIQMRFNPMPGYKFNTSELRFVKK